MKVIVFWLLFNYTEVSVKHLLIKFLRTEIAFDGNGAKQNIN